MRCLKCGSFTFKFICKNCKMVLSEFESRARDIDGFKVYSFYKYGDIKPLIYSKHQMHGHFVFRELAKLSFSKFADTFKFKSVVNIIALDDQTSSGYSHTAVLAHSMKSEFLKPIYGALRATNRVKYQGKTLEFRKNNPRNFKLLKEISNPIILVDDIITTGSSMKEAKNLLLSCGKLPLFGLVLADARE
ncbi:ComF family protein [Campylobacter hyointestinalis]|uniref:ComF family protein n=1 Tax=Campylobacter hyointestinalis subsp. lawsonii TaxID=91353 RepID=A0AAV6EII5_CAMHY|nr:ComF family protein [Campylobacter hyointestinalis]KAB0614435.1 ComF family protein [Campylobacter hyointestinalis subsp. lawsonii]QKF70189.1 transformation system, predicted amidophosphoribosyltransferase CtsW [Campylobacter hyointestinalis subsp. lawsonii]RAZ28697.1 ComF family protein [Campylobacter hyointestinalis subsp. lawsonii]